VLLRRGQTSPARASSALTPRLPDADRSKSARLRILFAARGLATGGGIAAGAGLKKISQSPSRCWSSAVPAFWKVSSLTDQILEWLIFLGGPGLITNRTSSPACCSSSTLRRRFPCSSRLFILIMQCTGSPSFSAWPELVIFALYSKKA